MISLKTKNVFRRLQLAMGLISSCVFSEVCQWVFPQIESRNVSTPYLRLILRLDFCVLLFLIRELLLQGFNILRSQEHLTIVTWLDNRAEDALSPGEFACYKILHPSGSSRHDHFWRWRSDGNRVECNSKRFVITTCEFTMTIVFQALRWTPKTVVLESTSVDMDSLRRPLPCTAGSRSSITKSCTLLPKGKHLPFSNEPDSVSLHLLWSHISLSWKVSIFLDFSPVTPDSAEPPP